MQIFSTEWQQQQYHHHRRVIVQVENDFFGFWLLELDNFNNRNFLYILTTLT